MRVWPGKRPPPLSSRRNALVRVVSNHWPVLTPTLASSRHGPARPNGSSRKDTVPAAGGLFFPQSRSLGIDQGDASPAVLQQLTYAGTVSRSFAEARQTVIQLTELTVSVKQVERVTERIGTERVAERDVAATTFQALPLVEKFAAPPGVTPPELVVVMADGGRLQIREPTPSATQSEAAVPVAATPGPDWEEEPAPRAGHWREDKVGLLLTMHSTVSSTDPCPDIPASFLDVVRIPKLARQLKKNAKANEEAVAETDEPEVVEQALQSDTSYQPPQVQQRQVVASRGCWSLFAPLLAAAAWSWGFQGATRKAFVADGSANNWTLQRRFFGSFVPILDFIHALSYVFAAAMAGQKFAVGWVCYQQWIRWVWQGQVGQVLAVLRARVAELGLPEDGESETSPRQVVSKALSYLSNHQDKMRYDEYRRQGLPLTSSLMESVVKQVNRRVKGTEKFWSEAGSEAVLQLGADHLSDGDPLAAFWERRQAAATGQNRYRRTA